MKKEEREALLKEKLQEMKRYEEELYRQGLCFIAGVDEVGRGPLAGPVVTACVILPPDFDILGVDDSKKLSEKKRNELFEKIKEKAIAYAIGMVDNHTIDEINILEATKRAMTEAILKADEKLKKQGEKGIEHILIDALTLKGMDTPQTGIIKGDASSVSIAAASIVAKVTRDRMMVEYAEKYTDYAFEKNKGYGTKAHYAGIEKAGICEIHRKTFLKKVLG
ncbi:ribonuclease HII [Aminipila luticellarii]|uniref:Ribonuclease HII n=1 Tax=Aminipila luticellarii TaxID=2507160 RepID=A0A410PU05_9FIRM|nr:ribonuclease HII [Aminipila luticellarii]QAT42394.1 ribonuclease HII [Aminipila luticellarii]